MRISNRAYRHVFLVQNRDYWQACPFEYDKEKDLVLSFDFVVVNMVKAAGGQAQYIDHIVSSEIMERYNYKTYEFFAAWYYNAAKQDIFSYRGIDVGSAFRIEIWNDITFYVRIFINLHELLKRIKYEKIYIGVDNPTVINVFQFLSITTIKWSNHKDENAVEYYFPIFRWMDEALHPTDIRYKIRVFVLRVFDKMFSLIAKLKNQAKIGKHIYVEWYHPTKDIISELKKANNIKIVRSDFNGIRDIFNGVHLPIFVSADSSHDHMAKEMLKKFDKEKCATLFVDDIDISNELHKVIIKRVSSLIAKSLKLIDVIIDFFAKRKLSLMITIASIGVINRLMINYCKKNNIPVYMIINGWLGSSFLDDAKDGTWINSYSESIKRNYFKNMKNVIYLGDPRMDDYANGILKKEINRHFPTIVVGAAGFSNIDLNSYLAFEFDFINDILLACRSLIKQGKKMRIIIKVRANGYASQYSNFLKEYFPDMLVEIYHQIPMKKVLIQADFYISIYSQTLFEASSLGIPVLYYKKDNEIKDPPFNGASELVTAFSLEDLKNKIILFYEKSPIFEPFMNKNIMEKYIGPLDGQNLKRNMDFIYSLC